MRQRGRLVIVGAGGFGLEAYWVAAAMNAAATADWQILGFADDGAGRVGSEHYGIPILCTSGEIGDRLGLDVRVHLAIGDNRRRGRLAQQFETQGLAPATLVHPRAETAQGTTLGDGSYVAPFATLAPHCTVGCHVIVNVGVVIGHETKVGDYAQLAPGAVATGGCSIGEGAFVGSNASLYPGSRMGDFSTVGSNSFVTTDVPAAETVIGVPAQPVFRKRWSPEPASGASLPNRSRLVK